MTAAKIVIAYWLLPAEPARGFFSAIVHELAARFDAPIFEPHLTLYAGTKPNEEPSELLRRTFAGRESLHLSIRDVQSSEQFTKTLFVQFEPDPRLSEISLALRRASSSNADYELNPHLSLIYKTMQAAAKSELAKSIRVPFREVRFDSAKAVACTVPIQTREDVEAWRVLAAQRFTE